MKRLVSTIDDRPHRGKMNEVKFEALVESMTFAENE